MAEVLFEYVRQGSSVKVTAIETEAPDNALSSFKPLKLTFDAETTELPDFKAFIEIKDGKDGCSWKLNK